MSMKEVVFKIVLHKRGRYSKREKKGKWREEFIGVTLHEDWVKELKTIANARKMSLSKLVREILYDYLKSINRLDTNKSIKEILNEIAKEKNTSIAELIREIIANYLGYTREREKLIKEITSDIIRAIKLRKTLFT